jgi:UDP-N-acetyl-D-glucosamine dehydrogenase
MAVAVASARGKRGEVLFDVTGIDLPTQAGLERIDSINAGRFPFPASDPDLIRAAANAIATGNLRATSDPAAYAQAAVVVVDIHLDVDSKPDGPRVDFEAFNAAIRTVGDRVKPGTLVIVETTVPPGTCERFVAPELAAAMERRGLKTDDILLAHSYERVMPGEDYLSSITHFWRVYAGRTPEAAEACERFLSNLIDTAAFPLTRLPSTTASETAKVLENSYRASNIAFIEEWGRFAEAVGIDLFEVISAIRVRPTHSNIRQPGFGVGGYCLTKDPLFAGIAARQIFDLPELRFPFSELSVLTNARMPLVSVDRLEALLGGSLKGRRVMLLGVSYRQDVGDTRYSPAETFIKEARQRGAEVIPHDPVVGHWLELGEDVPIELPQPAGLDAIVLAVPHRFYRELDFAGWLADSRPVVLDANAVLSPSQTESVRRLGCRIEAIGRGETS